MNMRNSAVSALIAAIAGCTMTVHAQISGWGGYDVRCGGSLNPIPFSTGDASFNIHGDCPSPREGGLASSNDGNLFWHIGPGTFRFESHAHTDFFGTHDDAGSASTSANFFYRPNDLVFSLISNPTHTGTVTVGGMHLFFGARATTFGVSNCSPFQPYAMDAFDLIAGPCRARATRALEPDFGVIENGAYVGYPNDGSMVEVLTSGGDASLASPYEFYLQIVQQNTVLYCDSPPAAVGDSQSLMIWTLPCGTPVFDLPPGYTANCPSLGIVNNMRSFAAITQQPSSVVVFAGGDASYSVVASGVGLFANWEWQPALGENFIPLTNNVIENPFTHQVAFTVNGATTTTLSLLACSADGVGRLRCVLSSECGSITSDAADLSLCIADFNADQGVDFFDYLDFVDAFSSQSAQADFNHDGAIDFFDYLDFVDAFSAGC